MRKSLFRRTVAMLTLSAAAVSGACSEQEYEDLTRPEKVTGNTQYAPYTIDWARGGGLLLHGFHRALLLQ